MTDTIPTMVRLVEVDDLPIGEPCKNHDACVASVSHQKAVAHVMVAMEAATTIAMDPSIRRTTRERVSRFANAMAVVVHEASASATSSAHAATTQEYASFPPFRWNSLSWCAHSDKGITEATTKALAITERSTCRRT